jgi:uncharacterized membrane-anchored protein
MSCLQTIAGFIDRRFQPAMRTRVDITMAEQHRALLRPMDQRADLQPLLTEAVEGMSVVVITCSTLCLISYVLMAQAHRSPRAS